MYILRYNIFIKWLIIYILKKKISNFGPSKYCAQGGRPPHLIQGSALHFWSIYLSISYLFFYSYRYIFLTRSLIITLKNIKNPYKKLRSVFLKYIDEQWHFLKFYDPLTYNYLQPLHKIYETHSGNFKEHVVNALKIWFITLINFKCMNAGFKFEKYIKLLKLVHV